MIKEAIILAGGFGTRLQKVVSDVPKPMAPVNGRPFLEYVFRYIKHYKIKKAVLSVGFKAEAIQEHFGERFNDIEIEYAFEHEPLGTGGAVKLALGYCASDNIVVLNGDTLFDADLHDMQKSHFAQAANVTICLRKVPDVSRYGTVKVNEQFRITGFEEKQSASGEGYINGGIYLMRKDVFVGSALPAKFSLEKDFFEKAFRTMNMHGYVSNGYFIDIGIPEDYQRAQAELKDYEF
jgi:D-glycero-alpha-D-manno-heptose 1-phosphate guanylyltransferase